MRPLLVFAACALAAHAASPRLVRYGDVPESLRPELASLGADTRSFESSLRRLADRTRERVTQGEEEHLVYYVLQSSRFTRRPRIEPGESARAFVDSLAPAERERFLNTGETPACERVPVAASARMRDFLASPARRDERAEYLQGFVRARAHGRTLEYLCSAYGRAMRFLYSKEFAARGPAEVESLYTERGHSTDTSVEANFAVYNAVGALHGIDPAFACRRLLVVGPGLDFAPRTDLVDVFPPQSHQPFAIADSLIALGAASGADLAVDCADVNPRVIRFFDELPRRASVELALFTGARETGGRDFTEDFKDYFQQLGRRVGVEHPLRSPAPALAGRLAKRIAVHPDVVRRIRAQALDIVTERYEPAPGYDLVVATNVLTYFAGPELGLALANIASMLRDGGYLIHNDARPAVLDLAGRAGLRPLDCRTVLIARGGERPLYDAACVLRKSSR